MSATNRGGTRVDNDFYATPTEYIDRFVYYSITDGIIDYDNKRILDPCAGGIKDVSPMPYAQVLRRYTNDITTMDIRQDSPAGIIGDYLAHDMTEDGKYDIIISNPPFYLAQEFIEKALTEVVNGGYVIFLVRLNFFESSKRLPLFRSNMPTYAYVYHDRPSFTPDGKTDAATYQHLVFKKGFNPDYTMLKII